ncbi:MAG: hypothetical protein NXI20_09460 [bacterium]|nr:hypothetical protein [bacterium]
MNLFKKISLSFKKIDSALIAQLVSKKDIEPLQHIFQKSSYKKRISYVQEIGKVLSPHAIDVLFHFINDSVRIVVWEIINILSLKPLSEVQTAILKRKRYELTKADEKEKNWPKGKPRMGYNKLGVGFKETPSDRMNENYNHQRDLNYQPWY